MKNQKGSVNLVLIGALIILVGAVSYFAWSKKSNNVNITEPLPSTTSEVDTSTWKTYSNSTLELSLKYPANWSVDTSHEHAKPVPQVSFYPPAPEDFEYYFGISNNTAQAPYDGFDNFEEIKEFYAALEKEPNANYKFSFQETTVGGLKALVVLRSDTLNHKTIHFFRNGIDYTIGIGQYNTEETNGMLATLKFTK